MEELYLYNIGDFVSVEDPRDSYGVPPSKAIVLDRKQVKFTSNYLLLVDGKLEPKWIENNCIICKHIPIS